MNFGFHPVPKPEKGKTDYKERRYNRKRKRKKKVEMYNGVKIPDRKKRSAISKKEYNLAIEYHGSYCLECGHHIIEMHHAVFRSQQGRGTFRNLIPLCNEHHRKCHQDFTYAQKWRDYLKTRYGPYYYQDRFDLWKAGIIHNYEELTFNLFMEREQSETKRNELGRMAKENHS